MTNHFHFKQFRIIQERSAMKVGTDGILLGAWADISNAASILDVGTGTGLIALMLAQRSSVPVTGVEIDKAAADEALENVSNSPWKNRILIINNTFQNYAKDSRCKFDLIASNPPFFEKGIKPKHTNRFKARHNDYLPFPELVQGAEMILSEKGRLAVILPIFRVEEFCSLAENVNLYLSKLTSISPNASKPPNRCLMEFSKTKKELKKGHLNVYLENNKKYSEEYIKLTCDYYLKH